MEKKDRALLAEILGLSIQIREISKRRGSLMGTRAGMVKDVDMLPEQVVVRLGKHDWLMTFDIEDYRYVDAHQVESVRAVAHKYPQQLNMSAMNQLIADGRYADLESTNPTVIPTNMNGPVYVWCSVTEMWIAENDSSGSC